MSVKLLEILKELNFIVDESVLWSILSSGVIFIQNKNSSRDYEFGLMSLESIHITEAGQFTVTRDVNDRYSRSYFMPEIVDLKKEWVTSDDQRKEAILLYSLAVSLRYCTRNSKDHATTCSHYLASVLDQMTDHNAAKRLTLLEVLRICNAKGKEFTKGRTFNYVLSTLYKSFLDQTQMNSAPKMGRSMSQSSVVNRRPSADYSRQLSLGNIDIEPSPPQRRHNNGVRNGSYVVSSIESISNQYSNCSSSPNVSDNNLNKGIITTSNYENLILNAIDGQRNLTEAIEKIKARRKVIKSNGPVKSPAHGSLPQSLNNSAKDSLDSSNGLLSQSHGSKLQTLIKDSLAISTIERIGGFRHILGPEFVIRSHETFNVTFSFQKRNSIFSRTDSGRLIRSDVMVHLLNGVVLLVRNLNSKSTTSQVINAINHALPDLEFVSYGLCFSLDSEFFFLHEDVNIYKLINYVSHKITQSQAVEKSDSNGGLHLYYRLKFYPTRENFRETSPFDRRLLYLQLRQDLLNRNNPPITVSDALSLAGAAVQTEYGDNSENLKDNLEYLKMNNYFHDSFIPLFEVMDTESTFLREQQKLWSNLKWSESESIFIEKVMSNRFYGLHWYKVNKNQLSIIGAAGKETFIALDRHGIQMMDISRSKHELQVYKHFQYKWKQIESITIKQKKLMIKPKMQLKVEGIKSGSYFPCYLDSKTKAEYIVRLCKDHHLIASQIDDDDSGSKREICNDTGSHLRLSTSEYPTSLKPSIDVEDDEIFVDYASSDDEVCDSSKEPTEIETLSSKYRLDCLKSLEKMNMESAANESSSFRTNQNNFFNFRDEFFDKSNDVTNNNSYLNSEIQSPTNGNSKETPHSEDLSPDNIFEVEIHKSKDKSIGIGILNVKIKEIQGIFIQSFVPNGAAAKSRQLKVGDEIISINNQPVSHMTQTEVGEVMQTCGNDITLLIRRHNLEDLKMGRLKSNAVKSAEPPVKGNSSKHNGNSSQNAIRNTEFKVDNMLQKLLSSPGSLETLRTNYTTLVIPPMNLNSSDHVAKRKIDTFAAKEIKGLQERLQWNSKKKPTENGAHGEFCDIKITLNHLSCQTLGSNGHIKFSMLLIRRELSLMELIWQKIKTEKCRVVLCFISKDMDKWLFQTKEVIDSKYKVSVNESCHLTDAIAVRRLSIGSSADSVSDNIFQIQFCEWNNEELSADISLQIANLACLLHQNVPNFGSVTVVYDDPSYKPTDFIVMFITVLLKIHCELSFHAALRNQTLVHLIYNQIILQSKDLLPLEAQYNSCLSVLKLLLPCGDRCDSSSEISDYE